MCDGGRHTEGDWGPGNGFQRECLSRFWKSKRGWEVRWTVGTTGDYRHIYRSYTGTEVRGGGWSAESKQKQAQPGHRVPSVFPHSLVVYELNINEIEQGLSETMIRSKGESCCMNLCFSYRCVCVCVHRNVCLY